MRRVLLLGMMAMAVAAALSPASAGDAKSDKKGDAPYVHVVVFRMKEDAPKDAVEKAIADCRELLTKVPTVRCLRAGRPDAKGTRNVPKMQYDFALLVLFEDADGLKTYIDHPLHQKFVQKHGPNFNVEKLQVFDFLDQSK